MYNVFCNAKYCTSNLPLIGDYVVICVILHSKKSRILQFGHSLFEAKADTLSQGSLRHGYCCYPIDTCYISHEHFNCFGNLISDNNGCNLII